MGCTELGLPTQYYKNMAVIVTAMASDMLNMAEIVTMMAVGM